MLDESSDEEDEKAAALMNAVSLESLRKHVDASAREMEGSSAMSSVVREESSAMSSAMKEGSSAMSSAMREGSSAMREDTREGRSEANSEVIIEQEHTPTDREHNTLLSLLSTTDDVQRLQVLLVLMSIYHQSVYNGLTLTAQQAVFTDPQQQQGLQGYFLCNKVYARSVVHALCEVLKQEMLRPVTAQCAVYVMKYLLANHIYDDVLPAEVLDEFATM